MVTSEKGDGRVASAHHQIGKLAYVTLTPGMIEGERASIFVEMAHGARRCDGSLGGVGAIHGGAPMRKREHRFSAAAAYKKERSENQMSELQSLMRISYAVFCLEKK